LPDGEQHKTMATWSMILDFLADSRAGRDACLLALGGGVIGDICGFAAASWMRGIASIQLPTTLLAQVDSSVGGKTGVNHPAGKNLVGAFHQPHAVIADTRTLLTLPEREYRAGLAEVIKYGAIADLPFLDWLEQASAAIKSREPAALQHMVETSVRHKADIVAADEREGGIRAILNFGHSFAHALETITGYSTYLHGEAVAIGMHIASRLSELRGMSQHGFAARLHRMLVTHGLPVTVPDNISNRVMLQHMKLDKKNVARQRRLVLLQAPGQAVVDSASSDAQVEAAIDACR
jgi:3-dehydroquinate synthase